VHDEQSLGDGFSQQQDVERRGDAWCRSFVDTMGSRLWRSLCIAPDGITEGGWGESNQGWTIEYRFSRSR
jgi:hypothetical protein